MVRHVRIHLKVLHLFLVTPQFDLLRILSVVRRSLNLRKISQPLEYLVNPVSYLLCAECGH